MEQFSKLDLKLEEAADPIESAEEAEEKQPSEKDDLEGFDPFPPGYADDLLGD